ncbi:MAG TPA: DUF368 domain-containing protein [Candidatus Avamphibacillus sp.]|nr:DUF368 domain-containing protein [Candidatus Avamphibacillus sp.]
MEWKNIYRGIIMGASDVIPGVSGGTIALILGIYDQLINSINGLFSKDWRKHLRFLIPLGLGIAIAIFSLAKLIDWLLENYPGPLKFFFLGLILGVLPYLFHQAGIKKTFKFNHYIILIIGAVVIGAIAFFDTSGETIIESRSMWVYVYLFFSGVLASAAMILPGISGSMIMLVIGAYDTIMKAISNLYFDIIVVTGIGIAIGIFAMSRLIAFFLEKYRTGTFACVIGFVIGSLVIVFPGWPESTNLMLISVVTFAVGLFVAYILGKVEYDE